MKPEFRETASSEKTVFVRRQSRKFGYEIEPAVEVGLRGVHAHQAVRLGEGQGAEEALRRRWRRAPCSRRLPAPW
jgi:hypothetical protein